MAAISDVDRSVFENLCKRIHDFSDDELVRLHGVAVEVKAIVQSASDRQHRKIAASFRQMG